MAQIIFQGPPTGQTDINYTPAIDTPVVVYFIGSAYSAKANVRVGYNLFISGKLVASTSIFSNQPQEHRVLSPSMVYYTFPLEFENGEVKPVAIRIEPLNDGNTQFDSNDQITLSIL